MALGMIDNTNYGLVVEKTGTFIPNFTPAAGSIRVKQVGEVVFLSGNITIQGTWEDVQSNHFGDITGVDKPAGIPIVNVVSSNSGVDELHNGAAAIISIADETYISVNLNDNDNVLAVNGFYFTA